MFQRTISFLGLLLVISVTASAQTLAVLHSFSGTDGSGPTCALALGPQGDLYGTTTAGGQFGQGTVFSITGDGVFTLLHSFSGPDGAEPFGGLLYARDGNLYGMTVTGGTANHGVIYQVTPAGVFNIVRSFAGFDGNSPYGGLMQATNGNGYGFTTGGGLYGYGTIFRITPQGVYSVLVNFDGTAAAYPQDTPLDLGDGLYVGTTRRGGTQDIGVAFAVDDAGSLLIDNSPGALGIFYAGLIAGPNGTFYTTSSAGGEGYGSVVAINGDTLAMTSIDLFTPSTGSFAVAGVTLATDGNLYGASVGGPRGVLGTLYKTSLTGVHTTLHEFSGSDGKSPYGKLVQGPTLFNSEVFYGTTYAGGANGLGVVYSLTVPPAN
jgi:uncharacterized repeat protein (TIGR03803 family)